MRTHSIQHFIVAVIVPCLLITVAHAAGPMGTTFTYQGQLKDGSLPANGVSHIELSLHDDATAGAMVACPIVCDGGIGNPDAVDVANGLVNVGLDF